MEWYRRYADRGMNRKLFRASFMGSLVFDALCDVSCEFDLGGEITPEYQDLDWLARRMQLDRACTEGLFCSGDLEHQNLANPADLVKQGLAACLDPACGLVARETMHPSGSAESVLGPVDVWVIVGWEDRQPKLPEKSTVRVAKHREKLAVKRGGNAMKRDETNGNKVKRGETDIESEKEREKEKERKETLSANLPTAPVVEQLRLEAQSVEALANGPTPPQQVFEHWRGVMGKTAGAKLKGGRLRAVKARLDDGYSVKDLCQAVDGCAVTPHNMGQNDRGERYDDLELICRDVAHVERFMANARAPPRPRGPDPHKAPVRAEDIPKSAFAKTGAVSDF